MELGKKIVYVSPENKQKVEAVLCAACKYFEIERDRLFVDASYSVVNIKQMCIYLMKVNTKMSDRDLAEYLSISKSSVGSSVEKIRVHKNIYSDTMNGLRKICEHTIYYIPDIISIDGI